MTPCPDLDVDSDFGTTDLLATSLSSEMCVPHSNNSGEGMEMGADTEHMRRVETQFEFQNTQRKNVPEEDGV